jgi:hypothetical protein
MSRRFRDAEHLIRMAAIFAGGLLAFLLARTIFVPDDFGVLGHYRLSAIDDVRARPAAYAGQKACLECHTDVGEAREAGGAHARVACESCHGPLATHAAGEGGAERPEPRTICVRCHAANGARPRAFPQVHVREHADEGPCTTCHQPHAPKIS